MRKKLIKHSTPFTAILFVALLSCSKGEAPAPGGGTGGGGNGANCTMTTISQVNSGRGAESSLTSFFNSSGQLSKIIVFDSVAQVKTFEANLSYVTTDSIRLDPYQYILLDSEKRVVRFVTKANMRQPSQSDQYRFDYSYNSEGYLLAKNLFINGSAKANFRTVYTYTNGNLIACVMTSPSAGDLKALESALSYDNTTSIKNWIYTFPDAMEGYYYVSTLNFGKQNKNALTRMVTKILHPTTGAVIDTWTTNFGKYTKDAQGYITGGEATGDLQQGFAAFYGKTNFYYTCK